MRYSPFLSRSKARGPAMEMSSIPSIDLAFLLTGSAVPVDHGYALYAVLSRMLFPTFHKIAVSLFHIRVGV